MSSIRSIPLAESGPNVDKDVHEKPRVEREVKEANQRRSFQPNDPLLTEAVANIKEMAEALGRKVGIEYETKTDTAVITIYSQDGEEVIRQIPQEEAIRMSERLKENRVKFLDDIL